MWNMKTFGKNASREEARFLKFDCKGTKKYGKSQIICVFFVPLHTNN